MINSILLSFIYIFVTTVEKEKKKFIFSIIIDLFDLP